MPEVDLLGVKLSERILLRQRVQLAGDKESPLLNRGVHLSLVDQVGSTVSSRERKQERERERER